jgi:hypothetical protein
MLLLLAPATTIAQNNIPRLGQANTFESREDARLRQNSNQYQTYKNNGYKAPWGGYKSTYGDSDQGSARPGYVSSNPNFRGYKKDR